MMYISLLVTSLFSQGAEYVTASLARGFAVAGHKVDVVVSGYHTKIELEHPEKVPFDIGESVRLIRLPNIRARSNIFTLRRYIKTHHPDVMLCNAAPFVFTMIIANLLLPTKLKTTIINVEHLSGIGLDSNGNLAVPRFSIRKFVLNRLNRLLDAIFTVSEGNRNAINRVTGYPLEKIYTVFNPAIDKRTDYLLAQPAKHPWLKNRVCPVFVAAGALTGWKNFELLIKAFSSVRRFYECKLIIFGEGPRRGVLETLIRENKLEDDVSLPGFTNQLPAEIKASTSFVVSSDVESFSIVLVEALAARVPVVSTNALYGPPEILENGRYGLMVNRGDPLALAQAMMKILEGKGILAPISRVNEFRVERIIYLYEKCIDKVRRCR